MTEEEKAEREKKDRRAKRIAKRFPHLMWGQVSLSLDKYKTERGLLAALDKRNTKAEKRHAAPVPDVIEVDVEWRKSRIWGYCPVATAKAYRDSIGYAAADALGEYTEFNISTEGHDDLDYCCTVYDHCGNAPCKDVEEQLKDIIGVKPGDTLVIRTLNGSGYWTPDYDEEKVVVA